MPASGEFRAETRHSEASDHPMVDHPAQSPLRFDPPEGGFHRPGAAPEGATPATPWAPHLSRSLRPSLTGKSLPLRDATTAEVAEHSRDRRGLSEGETRLSPFAEATVGVDLPGVLDVKERTVPSDPPRQARLLFVWSVTTGLFRCAWEHCRRRAKLFSRTKHLFPGHQTAPVFPQVFHRATRVIRLTPDRFSTIHDRTPRIQPAACQIIGQMISQSCRARNVTVRRVRPSSRRPTRPSRRRAP